MNIDIRITYSICSQKQLYYLNQCVSITATAKIGNLSGEVCDTNFMMKFITVRDLLKVCGFLWVILFASPIILTFLNQGCTLIDRIRVMSVYIQQYFCYIVVIVSIIGEANRITQRKPQTVNILCLGLLMAIVIW
jgi:hypothetical protein